MAQQTAITLLEKRLKAIYEKEGKLPLAYTLHIIGQAKELEKEQIMLAYSQTGWNTGDDRADAEQYYLDTYLCEK